MDRYMDVTEVEEMEPSNCLEAQRSRGGAPECHPGF